MSRIYLRRQVLHLSAEGVRGAAQSRHLTSAACMASYRLGQGCPDREPEDLPPMGRATSSARSSSRSSSRPTPRRCGACPATRSPPTGRRSASRASSLGRAVIDGLKRSLGLNEGRDDGDGSQDPDRDLPLSAPRPRHDVGRGARPRSSRRAARIDMDRELEQPRLRRRHALWTVDARRRGGRGRRVTARHVISSAPIRELVEAHRPAALSRCRTRARCAIATSSPSR